MQRHQNADAIRALNDLLARQHAHLAANAMAHDRLFRDEARATADAVRLRHRKQVRELAAAVQQLGGSPRRTAKLQRFVPLGRVVLADLGGDSSLVRAMRTNALRLQAAYERARASEVPNAALAVLTRHTVELARERAWLELRDRETQTRPAKA